MMSALWVLFYPPVFVRSAIINIRGSFFVPSPPPPSVSGTERNKKASLDQGCDAHGE